MDILHIGEPILFSSRDINSGELYREFLETMNEVTDISESMKIIISKNKNQIFDIFEDLYSQTPEAEPIACYMLAVLVFIIKK